MCAVHSLQSFTHCHFYPVPFINSAVSLPFLHGSIHQFSSFFAISVQQFLCHFYSVPFINSTVSLPFVPPFHSSVHQFLIAICTHVPFISSLHQFLIAICTPVPFISSLHQFLIAICTPVPFISSLHQFLIAICTPVPFISSLHQFLIAICTPVPFISSLHQFLIAICTPVPFISSLHQFLIAICTPVPFISSLHQFLIATVIAPMLCHHPAHPPSSPLSYTHTLSHHGPVYWTASCALCTRNTPFSRTTVFVNRPTPVCPLEWRIERIDCQHPLCTLCS